MPVDLSPDHHRILRSLIYIRVFCDLASRSIFASLLLSSRIRALYLNSEKASQPCGSSFNHCIIARNIGVMFQSVGLRLKSYMAMLSSLLFAIKIELGKVVEWEVANNLANMVRDIFRPNIRTSSWVGAEFDTTTLESCNALIGY